MNEETKDVHFELSSGLENGILYVYRVHLLQSFFFNVPWPNGFMLLYFVIPSFISC